MSLNFILTCESIFSTTIRSCLVSYQFFSKAKTVLIVVMAIAPAMEVMAMVAIGHGSDKNDDRRGGGHGRGYDF